MEGAVYYPGEYPILDSDETLYEIINRAGGVKKNAFLEGSFFSRAGNNVQIDLKGY